MRKFSLGAFCFFMAFLSNSNFVTAQSAMGKAEKLYELYAFSLAKDAYEEVIKSDPSNMEAMLHLADSYYHLNQLDKAASVYAKAIVKGEITGPAVLKYGQTLMGLGRYTEAKSVFQQYEVIDRSVSAHFVSSCNYALSGANSTASQLIASEYINTSGDDFGVAIAPNDNLVYVSTRKDLKRNQNNATGFSGAPFNQLFLTQRDGNQFMKKPSFLRGDIKGSINEGPVAYTANGDQIAISRNNFMEGVRRLGTSGMELSLFIGDCDAKGDWNNLLPFPHNVSGYSTGFPAFSPDGTTLFFASNRPGGYGGYDIYMSKRVGNTWSMPQNLGPVINSPGDEITPFFDGRQVFFASNWHGGYGGYDVFQSAAVNGIWNVVNNMGNGINSSSDDYGYIVDPSDEIGYFVSNRNGKGGDDIYRVFSKKDDYKLAVINAVTNQPVGDANFDLSACKLGKLVTNANGEATLSVKELPVCNVTVSKEGYTSQTFSLSSSVVSGGVPFIVKLVKPGEGYVGMVRQANASLFPIENALITATHQGNYSQVTTTTDQKGKYVLGLAPNSEYLLRFSAQGYKDVSKMISMNALGSKDLGIIELISSYDNATQTSSYSIVDRTTSAEEISSKGAAAFKDNETVPTQKANYSTKAGGAGAKTNDVSDAVKDFYSEAAALNSSGLVSDFAIQFASISLGSEVEAERFKKELGQFGAFYVAQEGGAQKLRLGGFLSRDQAEAQLANVRNNGYPGAFIVADKIGGSPTSTQKSKGTAAAEKRAKEVAAPAPPPTPAPKPAPVQAPSSKPTTTPTTASAASKGIPEGYLVRLAAYKNLDYFDKEKVIYYGTIETVQSNGFTVKYLSGYKNLADANAALAKVKDKGFSGAYVVTHNKSVFTKVK